MALGEWQKSVIHLPLLLNCFIVGGLCLIGIGCDTTERISRLEKQVQELQAEAKNNQTTTDYDLQAKCSRDAKTWFTENWSSDKDTILLDHTNHYNKSLNKCFVFVEYHYRSTSFSWTNDMSLWDVYENSQYGTFIENHTDYGAPNFTAEVRVLTCKLASTTCKTPEEFNRLAHPYMN